MDSNGLNCNPNSVVGTYDEISNTIYILSFLNHFANIELSLFQASSLKNKTFGG